MSDEKQLCCHVFEDGRTCKGTATADGHCPQHSPRFTDEQRQEWRASGGSAGKRKGLAYSLLPTEVNNLDDVAKLLRIAMVHVAMGELDPVLANSLSNLAATLGKLSSQTKFESELSELRAMLDKLKRKKGIENERLKSGTESAKN